MAETITIKVTKQLIKVERVQSMSYKINSHKIITSKNRFHKNDDFNIKSSKVSDFYYSGIRIYGSKILASKVVALKVMASQVVTK